MTRIVIRVDRLTVQGVNPGDGEAVAQALRETLAQELAGWAQGMPSAEHLVEALRSGIEGAGARHVVDASALQGGSSVAAADLRGGSAADASRVQGGPTGSAVSGMSSRPAGSRSPIQVTAGDTPALLGSSAARGIVRGWMP